MTEIASMALDLLAGSVVFQIPHRPNARLNIRMGIHRSARKYLRLKIFSSNDLVVRHVGWWPGRRSQTIASCPTRATLPG